jgi:ATP:ADP antiporter, AAA family
MNRAAAQMTSVTFKSAPSERRVVIAAFVSLFGILCAQALLETARDTLFLTHVQVVRLPWLYLAMAALTVIITAVSPGAGRRFRSRAVSMSMLVGAAVTAGLGLSLGGSNRIAVYILFLWTGIFSAFTVTQIWTALAETVDMSFAKRLYGRLAAGGGLGAVAGAAIARLLGNRVEPRHLVLLAAAIAAVTALGPALALRGAAALERSRPPRPVAPGRRLRRPVEHPYVARLLAMALVAAALSTLIDFSFKEAVAAHLSIDRLPRFFATFHLATSVVSLLIQLFGVAWLVRVVGVKRVQMVFPLLILGGVLVTMGTGGLASVVLLRGLDTALRNSFQRPTFELLQVPLGDQLRRRAKPVIDAIGQRGGQAVAGIGLLLMFRWAAGPEIRLGVAALLLAVWLVVAFDLGRRYVDLLRSTLIHREIATSSDARPQLDAAVRGTLMAALASARAPEVRAALDLSASYGQTHLIPPRLLDHESPAVVLRVIELLPQGMGRQGTAQLVAALDRLLDHPDGTVRKAALRRRAALAPDRAALVRLARTASCPTLRGVALVILVDTDPAGAADDFDTARALTDLAALATTGDFEVRLAIAEAIVERPSRRFEKILLALAGASEPQVLAPVAGALGVLGGAAAITALVKLLGTREARVQARAALTQVGTPAFDVLAAALADPGRPVSIRANVARALVEIDPERSLGVLLDGLLVEEDGFVRFRILRALNRVRRLRPKAAIDEDILGRAAVAAAESAYRYLAWRIFIQDGADRVPERRTPTWLLLRDLLDDKEQNAVERLFRVLTLRYPREDFRKLLRALRLGSRRMRANSRELIENLLTGPAQALTLALIDDIGDRDRLSAMTRANPSGGHKSAAPRASTYRDLLTTIRLEEQGGTLAALAGHHLLELAARRGSPGADGPVAVHA